MKDWFNSKFFETLAGKLTAILAFAILLVAILALLGKYIEDRWLPLVYIVEIAAMIIFTYQIFVQNKPSSKEKDVEGSEVVKGDSESQRFGAPKDKQPTEKPAISFLDARRMYLQEVIREYMPFSLNVLDTHSGDPKGRLALEDIYIALNTTTQVDKDIFRRDKTGTRPDDEIITQLGHESKPLAALEALDKAPERRMVLLGRPGTGKSTFVRYLALRMAQLLSNQSAKPLDGWTNQPLLPVAISLGRFAEEIPMDAKRGTTEMLESFIKSTLERSDGMKEFAPSILDALRKEGGLFLFDGLDEVSDLNMRPIVVQAVESFVSSYNQHSTSRFLVTCRTYSYEDERWKLTNWPVYELALFTPDQIDQFIQTWYALHSNLEPKRAREYQEKRAKLLAAVQPGDPRRLHEIAPFPIILTVMAVVHASHELPDSRALVYERCVEILLEKWQLVRSIQDSEEARGILTEMNVPASQIYSALYEIAYEAHKGFDRKEGGEETSTSQITEGLVVKVLHDQIGDREKEDIFLEYCQKANGLLMLRGTVIPAGTDKPRRVYTLPHLTFEEYLASRFMKKKGAGHARELFDEGEDRWREAIKFMAEFLCFSNDADRDAMNGLLEAFSSPFPKDPKELDWRALWLAGELLVYYRRRFTSKPSVYENNILKNLHDLVDRPSMVLRDRADAADILDQLWQPDDLYKFIFIADAPTPDLYVARYPVTNAQYERFLLSDFGNQKYWTDFPKYEENSIIMHGETWGAEAWEWLQRELDDKNDLVEDGVLYPRYWRDPRFGIARRGAPVVGVSWYEANAYCNWLKEYWDDVDEGSNNSFKPRELRLPTDNEWTVAAGGENPQERYPWDGKGATKNTEEITQRANVRESEINRTTPVWMYPQGESTTGVMDMSGNIWEWQANFRDKKGGWLGLRGGSWINNVDVARVSIRNNNPPSSRHYDLGFRVVALPSG